MLRAPRKLALLCLFTVACLSPLADARVSADQVVRDDRQYILLDKPFGFSKTGHLELTISNFAYWQSTDVPVNLSEIGFFLTSYQVWQSTRRQLCMAQQACYLHSEQSLLPTPQCWQKIMWQGCFWCANCHPCVRHHGCELLPVSRCGRFFTTQSTVPLC